jgi:hypothetical protein
MLAAFVLFLILVIWGAIDGEIYATECIILVLIWLLCLLGFLFVPTIFGICVAAIALVDIYLIIKLVGNPKAF